MPSLVATVLMVAAPESGLWKGCVSFAGAAAEGRLDVTVTGGAPNRTSRRIAGRMRLAVAPVPPAWASLVPVYVPSDGPQKQAGRLAA